MSAVSVSIPPSDVSFTHVASTPVWQVLYVLVHSERKVSAQLARYGVEHFLPQRDEIHRWTDRRMKVKVPLFPGYLFIKCAPIQRGMVAQMVGVLRFVGSAAGPAVIPDPEFARLRELLEARTAHAYDYVEPGKRVRLSGGIFDGFEGTYVRDKGRLRAVVAIDWLQRSVIVDVDVCELQPSARAVYVATA